MQLKKCITNFRTKLAKVFTGKEWKTMKEDILFDELIKTYEGLLEDWAEDHPERMKYIEQYKQIKERDGESNVMKKVKDEVKMLIYDKRDMIKIKNLIILIIVWQFNIYEKKYYDYILN